MGDNIPVKYPAYFGKLVLRSGNEPERDQCPVSSQQHHVDSGVSRPPSGSVSSFLSLSAGCGYGCGVVSIVVTTWASMLPAYTHIHGQLVKVGVGAPSQETSP